MAFPFVFPSRLRQQFLLAIGSSGLISTAAMGCGAKHPLPDGAGRGGTSSPAAGSTAAGSTAAGSTAAGSMAAGGVGAGAGGRGAAGAPMCELGRPAQRECFTLATMKQKAKFGCGQIPISPVPTDEQVATKFLANGCLARTMSCDGCCNPAHDDGVPQGDGSCCYTFCGGACCGRPFIVGEEQRAAGLEVRTDWGGFNACATEIGPLADRIAAEWLEDARMEHASIASFARFTLDLLTYGAPAELVEAAQRAGLDECEHAKLCFGLAARFGAGARGPSQLRAADAQVAPSLWHATIAAFREGCIGETRAAMQASAAWERAEDPEVTKALARIAADEASHAELAWRFVAWAVPQLGEEIKLELRREVNTWVAPPAPHGVDRETESAKQQLRKAGRLTSSEKQLLDHQALHEIIVPCVAALLDSQPIAASTPADSYTEAELAMMGGGGRRRVASNVL